jgi:hypothetical protein
MAKELKKITHTVNYILHLGDLTWQWIYLDDAVTTCLRIIAVRIRAYATRGCTYLRAIL